MATSVGTRGVVPLVFGRLRAGRLGGGGRLRREIRPMATNANALTGEHFFLDAFAERQWDDENYKGGRITFSKAEFTQRVNDHYAKGGTNGLIDGYAPFCKHVFVPNFLDLPVQAVQITDKVAPFVESGYVSRTVKELPVLTRWIRESNLETVPTAKMLDIILYSRKQIIAERVAQGMHIHSHSHAPARARST